MSCQLKLMSVDGVSITIDKNQVCAVLDVKNKGWISSSRVIPWNGLTLDVIDDADKISNQVFI